ncbi:MAG: 4-hydroxy-tetrahydrodipicolinate reductase [Rickettsiales bacterium]
MKIAVAGCTGRMGLTVVKAVLARDDMTLVAGSRPTGFDNEAAKAQLVLADCHGLSVTSDPKELMAEADALIDFTYPEVTLSHAEAVAEKGAIHIIGTTGFTGGQQKRLETLSEKATIVQAGNFSLGVNLLAQLVEQAAKMLDENYDIEINEVHHRHKKDAPSGTALLLGRAAARGRGVKLEEKKAVDRSGERKLGDIGFSVQRAGGVVGIHDVTLAGENEMITLSHQGFNRKIFADGSLTAALWAKDKKPGLYSMRDVLALS